jgi:hypothetical protein
MPASSVDPRQLMPIAMSEALIVASVFLRFALKPGDVLLSRPAHVVWLVCCLALPLLGVSFFVMRTAALLRREAKGEAVADARKQVLAFSLAMMVPPLALAWAGPHLLEAVLP